VERKEERKEVIWSNDVSFLTVGFITIVNDRSRQDSALLTNYEWDLPEIPEGH